jgi:hypothetical protein
LLVSFALLGFAALYAFSGASHAATTRPTATPGPDPPPRPKPDPRPVQPPPAQPPPAPPPPAQRYIPPPAPTPSPPPAPPAAVTPPPAAAVAPRRARTARRQAARQKPRSQPKKKAVSTRAARSARRPEPVRQRPAAARSVVPVAAETSRGSSILLSLTLGAVLGLSLLVVVLALTPAWALPEAIVAFVYARRGALMFWGFSIALTLGVAMTVTAY